MCRPDKCKQDIRPWAWKSCFTFAAVSRQLQNNRITKYGIETINRRSTPWLRDWIPPLQYIFRPISSEAGRFFVVVIRTSATADRSACVPEAAGCRIVHADLRVDALPGAPHAGRVYAIPHHIRHHCGSPFATATLSRRRSCSSSRYIPMWISSSRILLIALLLYIQ